MQLERRAEELAAAERRAEELAAAAAERSALQAELQQLREAQAAGEAQQGGRDEEAAAAAEQVISVLKAQLHEAQAAAAKVGEVLSGTGCPQHCCLGPRLIPSPPMASPLPAAMSTCRPQRMLTRCGRATPACSSLRESRSRA